jgi:MSHA biogenesis protein MshO
VELVMVIAVAGVLAAALVVFVQPAMQLYLAGRDRGELVHEADAALGLIVRDVRRAVPNSVRIVGDQCVELVPTRGGGLYRAGPDTVNDSGPSCTPGANCAAWVDTSAATTVFDVLAGSGGAAAVGDYLVINNQNANDVYAGTNRALVTAVSTPAVTSGVQRVSIGALQVSPGYDGGRFLLVPASRQAVFFSCVGADGTLDADGNGKGTLRLSEAYGFNASAPTSCPGSGAVLASHVRSCHFVYDPNQGATQQSGFVWLDIELARSGESAHLSMGAHVNNVP